ncbi:MAG: HTTM domain-containing protein [Acidobacteriota bacterium]
MSSIESSRVKVRFPTFLARWNHFFFSSYDPLPAAVFRISLGFLVVLNYVALAANWRRYYAADGMLSLTGGYSAGQDLRWVSVFSWVDGLMPVRALWGIGLTAAITFMVGWRTRVSTIVLFVMQNSMLIRNGVAMNAEDLMFRMLLFYGCFAPLGATLSVDRMLLRRRALTSVRGKRISDRHEYWPIRLMQINIALIYLLSLPRKLIWDSAWLDGTALYWTLMNDTWARWPGSGVFYGTKLVTGLTWGALLVEALFPLLVWFKTTRKYALMGVVALHLGIAIVLQNVTFFSLSMVSTFVLFVPASSLRAALTWFPRNWTPRLARVKRLGT